MDEIELNPCPFCGQMPKIRYRAFGCYGTLEVMCKPLFRREHLAVRHGAATMGKAFEMSVKDWNRRAEYGQSYTYQHPPGVEELR